MSSASHREDLGSNPGKGEYYSMDVTIPSVFLSPIFIVTIVGNTGETGDINPMFN